MCCAEQEQAELKVNQRSSLWLLHSSVRLQIFAGLRETLPTHMLQENKEKWTFFSAREFCWKERKKQNKTQSKLKYWRQ